LIGLGFGGRVFMAGAAEGSHVRLYDKVDIIKKADKLPLGSFFNDMHP
jgi:hypothetical protein